MPRYTCMESQEMMSPLSSLARQKATSLLPEPVGPAMAMKWGFILGDRRFGHKFRRITLFLQTRLQRPGLFSRAETAHAHAVKTVGVVVLQIGVVSRAHQPFDQ